MNHDVRVPVEFCSVGVPLTNALVPQFAHENLQGEKGQDAEAENDQHHDFH